MGNSNFYSKHKQLFVYVDETGNDGLSSEIGYGFLITHQSYEALLEIVRQAKSKCNMRVEDFFHASKDDDERKECLLTEINKSLSGEFFAIFEPKKDGFDNGKSSTNSTFKKLLRGLLVKFAFSPVEVNIVIEQKQGINSGTITEIIKKFVEYSRFGEVRFISYYDFLITQCNKKPKIPQYFNLIDCQDADKHNAGCQIIDFLLWTYTRNKSCKDISKFYDRINKNITISSVPVVSQTNNDNIYFTSYIINQFSKDIKNYYEDFLKKELQILNSELAELYIFIENTVEKIILSTSMPSNIEHHKNTINFIKKLINNARSGYKFNIDVLIKNVCKVFLYLFDTLPLYGQQDDLLWWLKAKALASSLYFKDKKELLYFYNSICIFWVQNNKYQLIKSGSA